MASLPAQNHNNNSGNRRKSGENNPKQIKSTAADQREHKQDYWKQIDETHLKDNGSLCRAKRRNPTKHTQLYKTLKLANVTKKMSLRLEFGYSSRVGQVRESGRRIRRTGTKVKRTRSKKKLRQERGRK